MIWSSTHSTHTEIFCPGPPFWTMRYRPAVFVGLIATIIYFDVTKDYNEQIWQHCENLMVWRSKESILVDRFVRFLDKSQHLASSFFIGFNGNIDVILNGESQLYNEFYVILYLPYYRCTYYSKTQICWASWMGELGPCKSRATVKQGFNIHNFGITRLWKLLWLLLKIFRFFFKLTHINDNLQPI